ncbi:MAG TPA: hypothetical protein DCP92_08695 [Nitrospiraceae bacterium]|nr:hypothetical protein [Nitrospiraceae bacterium]
MLAVIERNETDDLGHFYSFSPAGAGALILPIVVLLVHNLSKKGRYPEYKLKLKNTNKFVF